MEAAAEGWIEKPAPQKPDAGCDSAESKAGPGWRALGTIAPGMTHPSGRTDLADFDGDGRDDYVRVDQKNHTLADSSDHRNTWSVLGGREECMQALGWGFPAGLFAWAAVEFGSHGVEVFAGVDR